MGVQRRAIVCVALMLTTLLYLWAVSEVGLSRDSPAFAKILRTPCTNKPSETTSSQNKTSQTMWIASDGDPRPLCPDSHSRPGRWVAIAPTIPSENFTVASKEDYRWEPFTCRYHHFQPEDVRQCLADRTLVFAGDSLLRNMVSAIIQMMEGTDWKWTKDLMHVDQDERVNNGSSHILFYWKPSMFHFYLYGLPEHTTFVFHQGAWHLKAYNRGLTSLLSQAQMTVFPAALAQTNPVWVALHHIHTSRCTADVCRQCNVASRVKQVREIGLHAATCGERKVDVIDTWDLTAHPFAAVLGDDGVHLGKDGTAVEAQVVLNNICRDWVRRNAGYVEVTVPEYMTYPPPAAELDRDCSEPPVTTKEDILDREQFSTCFESP